MVASAEVAGLPMTSLLRGTPCLGISRSDEPGNAPPDLEIRLSQLV